MFTISEIYTLPNHGTFATSNSDKWDNQTKSEIEEEIKSLRDINCNGILANIIDYSIDTPLFGGKVVTFKLEDNPKLLECKCPILIK